MVFKLLLALLFPFLALAQIPEYYSDIDFSKTGAELKTQLTFLLSGTHVNELPYTSTSATDTWDVLYESDLVRNYSPDVLLIYGFDDNDTPTNNDRTRNKDLSCHTSSCIGLWNREHVFAKSLVNPRLDTSYPSAGTDVHNLRSCDSQMNSSRSNRIFQNGSGDCLLEEVGTGGTPS